jgi:hypothetical protein
LLPFLLSFFKDTRTISQILTHALNPMKLIVIYAENMKVAIIQRFDDLLNCASCCCVCSVMLDGIQSELVIAT